VEFLHTLESTGPEYASRQEGLALKVSSRLIIAPPNQALSAKEGQKKLFIDAKGVFGDGSHPSSRLALKLLDGLLNSQYARPCEMKGWVLDAGCGSGILALAAAALGDLRVLAVDVDSEAIDSARQNLGRNPTPGSRVFLAHAELSCARGPFCLVLANLATSVHVKVRKALWRAVAPQGWLILSGFLHIQKHAILRQYLRHGAIEKEYILDHGWAGSLLQKAEE